MTKITKPANAVKQQDFHATISTNVSTKEVFDKINDVAAWWTTKFEGSAQKLNDTFTVRFGEIWHIFKVTEITANKRIVWEVTDCHMPWLADKKEWKGTKLVWGISDKKNSTQVDFTHVGLTPKIECYGDCNRGWTFFIHDSLLELLNENKGDPHED